MDEVDPREYDGKEVLSSFGERLRTLRARRGMTRRALAQAADVSERYLASLEYGTSNPSLLILEQVSHALECSTAELVGDFSTSTPEWLLIRELLKGRDEVELRRARRAAVRALGIESESTNRSRLIALIGLRGAGKSTLGAMLAKDLGLPFIELGRNIESIAGYTIREIYDLYGAKAYRRYERLAVDQLVREQREAVIATPGGLVSETGTFNVLLEHCTTVWLQALPEEHMARVAAQGDMRPMAANPGAMDDLRRILDGRSPFYAKANLVVDTSRRSVEAAFESLKGRVGGWLDVDDQDSVNIVHEMLNGNMRT
jgi:XRE family aerobic/anaerobic benzoate catabolism transcriptional regulator